MTDTSITEVVPSVTHVKGSNHQCASVGTISTFGCSSKDDSPILFAFKEEFPMWSSPCAVYCNAHNIYWHLVKTDGTNQYQTAASI